MIPTQLFFDIDGVLAEKYVSSKTAIFFLRKGAFITAIKTHYIFPGVMETMKLFFTTPDVKVSFFSSGAKERNMEFVKELLLKSLGEEKYEKIHHDVSILSRNDMIESNDELCTYHIENFHLPAGNNKKDISKGLIGNEKLENAVLVDDDSTYIAKGQERNILKVVESKENSFGSLVYLQNKYDSEGYRKIPCTLIFKDINENKYFYKQWKERCYKGKYIPIFKNESNYEILYFNEKSIEKLIITKDEDEKLMELLDKLKPDQDIKDIETLNQIYKLIESRKGKTKKICRRANRIYYIVGLFFKAMELAKQENKPISDILFRLQYKQTKQSTFKPIFKKIAAIDEYYFLGLEKLRKINPNLAFTTPHQYIECVNIPPNEYEQSLIENAKSNESNECNVM